MLENYCHCFREVARPRPRPRPTVILIKNLIPGYKMKYTRNARGRFTKKASRARNARGRFTKRASTLRKRNSRGRFTRRR